MSKFKKLVNNKSDFPYIDGVDVYDYDNDFDYERYNATQMQITLCTVPWDMGEAHVGNRTISGIGNVVYFGSAVKRDAWFAAIPDSECYRFNTKYKELHRDKYIDVPVPFDICARHNYIMVEYNLFASDNSPVMYEDKNGVRKWFWFVREVEMIAANTTRLHLLDDAFQTWIYDVTISGMVLERGHAPMMRTKASEFLRNPIENCADLLTDDVNFGEASVIKHIDALPLNAGDMYACIATTANPLANWGTKMSGSWRTPASASYVIGGVPSVYVFAVTVANLSALLSAITSDVPQFKQTVQCIFFASGDLLDLGSGFEFAGVECFRVSTSRKRFDLVELEKSLFGYPTRYAEIAKLYTSPYAHIEICDESGNVDVVKIEDSTGDIDVLAALAIAYPALTIDAYLTGVSGSATASITYRNVTSHTFNVSGGWYETLRSWEIPTFAVVLDASREYDYSTYYEREQRVVDYTTSYTNALTSAAATKANADASAETARDNADDTASTIKTNGDASANTAKENADASASTTKQNADASANAAKANADASADMGKTNADANAKTILDNAEAQIAGNSTVQSRSAESADADSDLTNALSQALQAWESGYARDTTNNQVDAAYASAAIGAAGGAINSAISGGASGASAGPIGAVAGAIGGLVSGAIGGATSMAQTAVAANLTTSQAEASITLSQRKVLETSVNNSDRTANQNDTNADNTDTTNLVIDTTTKNSAKTVKDNATRAQTTEKGNAERTQTADLGSNARTYTTETGNNNRSKSTTLTNNQRTYTTASQNNARSESTALANNERSYNAASENAGRSRQQAISAIDNATKQAALREPFIYGSFANGEGATTKPIALFAHVVTQSKAAIESAGDEFLRYGYSLDKQWEFDGNWNLGKYFTYWKLRDFWVSDLSVPDMYMDKLRFFLFGGVTIWKNPDDIGKRTIYENFS